MESVVTLFNETTFQIACLIIVGWFCFYIYKDLKANHKENMQIMREDSEKDKERLYDEIKYNREVNKELLETNKLYAIDIKADLKEIKDIIVK